MLRASTRSVFTMLAVLGAVGTSACQSMEPSSDPFSPVPVAAAAMGAPASGGSVAPVDERFSDAPPVVMGSEDLKADPVGGTGGASVQVGAAVKPVPEATTEPEVSTAPVEAAPIVESTPPSAAPSVVPGGSMAWPVRLVRTHLDEQPPSAILALPDGRRIVVSPGDMVPERGLVVMAIGRERVQLAAINAQGDHATVVPMELTAQY